MIESTRAARRGFTLVELLMVIVIIGILAALVSAGVLAALNRGKQARVLTEINQLDLAIENYKSQYGGYPPSFGLPVLPNSGTPDPGQETLSQRQERFMRHVRLAFPRVSGDFATLRDDLLTDTSDTLDLNTLDAAEALVFWLGGIPDPASETLLAGFSADPTNPFAPRHVQPQRLPRLYEFDPRRLVDRDGDGWPEYVQDRPAELMPPYVYFDAQSYGIDTITAPANPVIRASYPAYAEEAAVAGPQEAALRALAGNWGYCRPYVSYSNAGVLTGGVGSTRFQIISAGLDKAFGVPTNTPLGSALPSAEDGFDPQYACFPRQANTYFRDYEGDNLTNFSDRKLEDVEP